MLGSVESTSNTANTVNCVLYQDVAIPAFTTDLVLQFDVDATAANNGCLLDAAAFIGLFPTTAVPGMASVPLGGTVASVCDNTRGLTLVTRTKILNAAAVAGTTVRLAFINSAGYLGSEIIAIDNVKLTASVTH